MNEQQAMHKGIKQLRIFPKYLGSIVAIVFNIRTVLAVIPVSILTAEESFGLEIFFRYSCAFHDLLGWNVCYHRSIQESRFKCLAYPMSLKSRNFERQKSARAFVLLFVCANEKEGKRKKELGLGRAIPVVYRNRGNILCLLLEHVHIGGKCELFFQPLAEVQRLVEMHMVVEVHLGPKVSSLWPRLHQ